MSQPARFVLSDTSHMANSRDAKPGYPHQPPTVAAPPDAGGHIGSKTTPGDVLQTPEGQQGEGAAPDLQYMDSRPRDSTRAPVGALIGIIVLAVALFLFFAYAFYDIP